MVKAGNTFPGLSLGTRLAHSFPLDYWLVAANNDELEVAPCVVRHSCSRNPDNNGSGVVCSRTDRACRKTWVLLRRRIDSSSPKAEHCPIMGSCYRSTRYTDNSGEI